MKRAIKVVMGSLSFAFLSLFASANAEDQPPLHVILFIGGINMDGNGHVEQQDIEASKDVLIWDTRNKSWTQGQPPFSRFSPHSHIRKVFAHRRLGPGPSFVRTYTKANPGVRVGIVYASRNVMDVRNWKPGPADDEGYPHMRLYTTAVKMTTEALASKPEGTGKPLLKGVLWHGGEEASQEGHLERYPKVLAEIIEGLRKDLPGGKSLPVVFSQLGSWNDYYVPFNKMITKQPAVIPATACVTTEGLDGTGMTFFNAGYRGLGKRYAKEMIRLLGNSR
jgi:hypothetical protein